MPAKEELTTELSFYTAKKLIQNFFLILQELN